MIHLNELTIPHRTHLALSFSVLPLEMRPYAPMYLTAAGYPYCDPRQLVSTRNCHEQPALATIHAIGCRSSSSHASCHPAVVHSIVWWSSFCSARRWRDEPLAHEAESASAVPLRPALSECDATAACHRCRRCIPADEAGWIRLLRAAAGVAVSRAVADSVAANQRPVQAIPLLAIRTTETTETRV